MLSAGRLRIYCRHLRSRRRAQKQEVGDGRNWMGADLRKRCRFATPLTAGAVHAHDHRAIGENSNEQTQVKAVQCCSIAFSRITLVFHCTLFWFLRFDSQEGAVHHYPPIIYSRTVNTKSECSQEERRRQCLADVFLRRLLWMHNPALAPVGAARRQ